MNEICLFYQHLPSSEWRTRASLAANGSMEIAHGEVPHRTVKAIIMELFKLYGEHLFTFTKTQEMEYIGFQLIALRDDSSMNLSQENSQGISNGHSTPSKERENPLKIQLTSIFQSSCQQSEYPQAILDLYQFVRKDQP